jgi:hypothetical protein
VIPYVDRWRVLAQDAIEEADAFVLLATPTSLLSEPCQFEWDVAIRRRKPLIRLDLGASWDHLTPQALAAHPSIVVKDPASDDFGEIGIMLSAICAGEKNRDSKL